MVLFFIFKVLGVLGSVCVIAVKSNELPRNELNLFAPPSPPPPPYPSPPPPSPPPPSPPPPSPSSPPPPLSPPWLPPPPLIPLRPPPPPPPPPPKSSNRSKNKPRRRRPPYPKLNVRNHQKRMNKGKEIGCLFVGVAGVIQVAVIGFLVYKRREISKISDRHESCS